MKKLTIITLFFVVAGVARIAHAADLHQINIDLLWEASAGNITRVQELIEKEHANIETKGCREETPLILASQKQHTHIVEYLLEHGANVNACSREGRTPLLYACYFSQATPIDLIETLIAHAADINHRDIYGGTALRWAISDGKTEAINSLLAHQADVNSSDNDGYTILMNACIRKNLTIVKRLLTLGADIYAKDERGHSALWVAKLVGTPEIYRYLIDFVVVRESTLHALLAADELAPAPEGYPAFAPELIDRVLRPLIKASLEEDQEWLLKAAQKQPRGV